MGDPDLAEHLRDEVKQRERVVIARRIELGPIAHQRRCSTRLCILRHAKAKPRAMDDAESLTRSISEAPDLAALEQLRVAALGKSGSVTAQLKSLGSMSPEERTARAPQVHALREHRCPRPA